MRSRRRRKGRRWNWPGLVQSRSGRGKIQEIGARLLELFWGGEAAKRAGAVPRARSSCRQYRSGWRRRCQLITWALTTLVRPTTLGWPQRETLCTLGTPDVVAKVPLDGSVSKRSDATRRSTVLSRDACTHANHFPSFWSRQTATTNSHCLLVKHAPGPTHIPNDQAVRFGMQS